MAQQHSRDPAAKNEHSVGMFGNRLQSGVIQEKELREVLLSQARLNSPQTDNWNVHQKGDVTVGFF